MIATQGETEELTASRRKRARFEREARPHLEFLRAQARRLTRSDADADDLAQDTLVRAYLYFDRYEEGTHFKAWLLQIQRNLFVNRYRKQKRERELMNDAMIPAVTTHSVGHGSLRAGREALHNAERAGVAEAIEQAVDLLPEPARSVLIHADFEGQTYREIANEMGTPIGTVMSRLHRARKELQAALREQAEQLGVIAEGARLPIAIAT